MSDTTEPTNTTEKITKVTSAATAKLAKQVADLLKIAESFQEIVNSSEDLSFAIVEKEKQLAALETQYREENRRRQVDLEVSFKENQAKCVDEILAKQGKIAVNAVEHKEAVAAFEVLKTEFTKRLSAETATIRTQEAEKTAATIATAKLQLQVQEAQNTASIATLKDKIALLESTIEDYKAQIDADRTARVQEAQARGNPTVTVNSNK